MSQVSMMQLTHPKVAKPKSRAFRHECQTAQLMPGKYGLH